MNFALSVEGMKPKNYAVPGPSISDSELMDSREIARITKKRHDHVLRDIEVQLGAPGIIEGGLPRFEDTYHHEQNGNKYRCYKLPKRESLILASGYDVVLRAAIIDRWIELESKAMPSPSFIIPSSMAEALRLAADLSEQVEENKKLLAIAAPKVAAQNLLEGAGGLFGVREAGKQLGIGQKAFVAMLLSKKIMYRLGGDLVPYQTMIDRGFFQTTTGTAVHGEDVHAWKQAKFTAKGIAWIAEKVAA